MNSILLIPDPRSNNTYISDILISSRYLFLDIFSQKDISQECGQYMVSTFIALSKLIQIPYNLLSAYFPRFHGWPRVRILNIVHSSTDYYI